MSLTESIRVNHRAAGFPPRQPSWYSCTASRHLRQTGSLAADSTSAFYFPLATEASCPFRCMAIVRRPQDRFIRPSFSMEKSGFALDCCELILRNLFRPTTFLYFG